MITSNLVGGLGNYMFQIAATFSLALDNNDDVIYDIDDNIRIHKHLNTYLDNIFRKIKFTNKKIVNNNLYEEPYFNYKKIEYKPNLKLNGYYQSEKYFLHNKEEVSNLFEIDKNTEDLLKKKYGDFLEKENCSIHVRRGDYLRLPNHHPVCDIEYYTEAVKKVGSEKFFIIFSDDIEWCKKNLDFIQNKIFIQGNTDYQDLFLMSKCDNNIIANSSFSWWGAWLNPNDKKIVVAPKKWFGTNNSHLNTSDLYCENWFIL